MTARETVELTLDGIVSLLEEEMDRTAEALDAEDLDATLDGCICALGLALQLGPAATERVLHTVLGAGRVLARRGEADGLSALGPALITLVDQVRESGGLPAAAVMDAWATVVTGLGALVGQIGLALTIPARHRAGMLDNARGHAILLDDATGRIFALTVWLDELNAIQ
jgi:hypothetical protein